MGVWVITPTGMMAALYFVRATNLSQSALFRNGGSNGLTAYVAEGVLWVANLNGGYTCADPETGRIRAYVGIRGTPSGSTRVVETVDGLFVGAFGGIDRIMPPAKCLGT
jgi:hypothetical protein